MRRLWAEDLVTFEGREHSIQASGIQPRPNSSIPIWIGGSAAVVLRRAAEIGDGFTLDEDLDKAPMVLAQLGAFRAARDRKQSAFGIAGRVKIDPNDLKGSARKAAA